MQRSLSIIAAVIFVALSASTADAAALSIKLCNQWHLATGKCTVLSTVLPVDSVYLSYVFPAEQKGLVSGERRFAVNTHVDRPFLIHNADKPHSGTSMFSYTQSPTYVGNSTRRVTFTMTKDGSHMTWQ